jgi:hypothetical protein
MVKLFPKFNSNIKDFDDNMARDLRYIQKEIDPKITMDTMIVFGETSSERMV